MLGSGNASANCKPNIRGVTMCTQTNVQLYLDHITSFVRSPSPSMTPYAMRASYFLCGSTRVNEIFWRSNGLSKIIRTHLVFHNVKALTFIFQVYYKNILQMIFFIKFQISFCTKGVQIGSSPLCNFLTTYPDISDLEPSA
jgi:hypothetical protein